MKKLVGSRLTLAGVYLIIGLGLTILGRSQVCVKIQHGQDARTVIDQEIRSAFRMLVVQNFSSLAR
ncbi:hypothetical protein GCM10027299_52200 [Larkinella ripae]